MGVSIKCTVSDALCSGMNTIGHVVGIDDSLIAANDRSGIDDAFWLAVQPCCVDKTTCSYLEKRFSKSDVCKATAACKSTTTDSSHCIRDGERFQALAVFKSA